MNSRWTFMALLTLVSGGLASCFETTHAADPPRYRPASIRLASDPPPIPQPDPEVQPTQQLPKVAPPTQIPPDWLNPPPKQPAELQPATGANLVGPNCDWRPFFWCLYPPCDCKPAPCPPNPCYPVCSDKYCGKPLPCPPPACYDLGPCYGPKPPVCKFPGNPCPLFCK